MVEYQIINTKNMSMLTPDKITEIFCIADDFCKEFAQEVKKHQLRPDDGNKCRNRSCEMSDSEIMTILLLLFLKLICFRECRRTVLYHTWKC